MELTFTYHYDDKGKQKHVCCHLNWNWGKKQIMWDISEGVCVSVCEQVVHVFLLNERLSNNVWLYLNLSAVIQVVQGFYSGVVLYICCT